MRRAYNPAVSESLTAPKRRFGLTARILLAMLLGAAAGYLLGPRVAPLGIIGKLIIQLIKGIAIPLVFFAIIEAIVSTVIRGAAVRRLFLIIAVNTTIAASIGLLLSNFFRPGTLLNFVEMARGSSAKSLEPYAARTLEFQSILSGYVPDSVIAPFVDNNMVAIILLSLLLGIALRCVLAESRFEARKEHAEDTLRLIIRIFETVLRWLVELVPLAVFGAMCKTVGEYGFAPLHGLAAYVAVGLLGLALQCTLVYPVWIVIVCGIPLRRFWNAAREPIVHGFGTNSSLATLPLTLGALESLGVSKSSSRLGACVATNLNNDGILLYEAMAVLFVAQAHGIDLSVPQQIMTALLCIVAAIGVAGIPEAGIISLSLVLSTAGMPLDLLPLLLTVDWLVARGRSVTNVLSDMTVSIALDGPAKKT